MRLAILQLAPVLRDRAHNAAQIAAAAGEAAADLLLTPELSLTGYDLGDDAAFLAAPVRPGQPSAFAPELGGSPDTIVGLPELGEDGVVYNTLAHIGTGRVLNVAEACAGLRSLMTFITIGAAMAFLSSRPMWQKAIVTLSRSSDSLAGGEALERLAFVDTVEGFDLSPFTSLAAPRLPFPRLAVGVGIVAGYAAHCSPASAPAVVKVSA